MLNAGKSSLRPGCSSNLEPVYKCRKFRIVNSLSCKDHSKKTTAELFVHVSTVRENKTGVYERTACRKHEYLARPPGWNLISCKAALHRKINLYWIEQFTGQHRTPKPRPDPTWSMLEDLHTSLSEYQEILQETAGQQICESDV